MFTKKQLLSVVALASALVAQGAQDAPRTPHIPKPDVEPVATMGADATATAPTPNRGVQVPRVASPIHTAMADHGTEYGIWGAGADYKVSFDGAMTFVPYLGADYPHNQPFAWTTQSVRIGRTELANGKLERRQAEFRYEYDLGDVTEAYDVRVEGLEQTFVIDRRPAGPLGDLVVEGTIDSMLSSPRRAPAHQPIDFFDEAGDRIFTYGAAFAVDAEGVKVPMTTGYADGVITLSLARQNLESLVFPVTVDPLLGDVLLRTSAAEVDPVMDCLREDEGNTDNLWYTYSRAASAVDNDLWIWRIDDQFAGTDVAVFQDLTASWSAYEPAIAGVGGANKTVTAFVRKFLDDTTHIRWHTHEYGDFASNTFVGARSTPSSTCAWRPDVGGTEAFSSGTKVVLVFQHEQTATFSNTSSSDIRSASIDVGGAGQGALSSDVVLAANIGVDFERPRVTQQSEGGANPVWGYVCQSYNNSIAGDDWDVSFRILDENGQALTSRAFTEGGSGDHKLGPVVAGQDGRFAVMYAISPLALVNFKTSVTTGHDIRVRRIDYDAATNATTWNPNLSSLAEVPFVTNSRRWIPGGLAYDTDSCSHWLATFASSVSNTAYCGLMGYRGGYVLTESIAIAPQTPRIGGVSYNDDDHEFALLLGVTDPGISSNVRGDVFQYTMASTETRSGTSCNPATLSWSGRGDTTAHQHTIGQEFGRIRVTGANPGDIHFMVMSLGTRDSAVNSAAVAPGCRLLVDITGPGYLGVLDFRVGSSAEWDQPIPEFLAADTIYFQDWIFDGVSFTSTQRMAVDIVK